jgi:hypothetical protein
MGSVAPAAKAALSSLCRTLFPSAQVTYGHPGAAQQPDIVAIGNVRSRQVVAALNAATRPREETFDIDVLVSVWRGGGIEAQQDATETAYGMVGAIEHALQVTNPTLSGTCRVARVSGHEMEEAWDLAVIEHGRVCEIKVVVSCAARI